MDGKPTNTFILLTFLLLGHTINSQTGEGCPNTNTACPAGQVRMNAIYNPSGAFIGGCNCFVIYCAFPRVYDTNSQTCQCSNRPRYGCPYHQFFNEDTCQCECIELQIPGSDLLTCIENTQPEPIVRPDCSCECLLPGCPANKFLNEQRCECQCPTCSLSNQMIIDQNTCQCGPKPITITTTTTRAPPPTTTTTTTIPPLTQPNTNNGPQVIDPPIIKVITTTPPQHINTNPPHTTIAHGGGGGGGHGTTIPPGTKAPYIPHCCQPKMSKFAPYYGQCWKHIDPVECYDVIGNKDTGFDPRGLCLWDDNNCLNENPICGFTTDACTTHTECCSHICKSDETCL